MARDHGRSSPPSAPGRDPAAPLTLGTLTRLFVPLSFSDMILVVAGPIIAAGLSRLPDAPVHLAAYGAAFSVAVLMEAPGIMLLNAATAAARDPGAYQALRRLMTGLALLVTAAFAVTAYTPVFDWIFGTVLGLPAQITAATRLAYGVMLPWPAAVAWRRFHQGYLIHKGRTRAIAQGALTRLATTVIVVVVGVLVGGPGAMVAGLALSAGSVVEALAITGLYAWERLREARGLVAPAAQSTDHGVPYDMVQLIYWYLPLAATQVLVWTARPLLSAGIARATLAEVSLAVWPVAWNTVSLLSNGTRMVQQLAISQIRDRATYGVMRRFTLLVGVTFSLLLALVAFSPAGDFYVTRMIGLQGPLIEPALRVLRWAAIYPFLVTLQNWYQALLVRGGRTVPINVAAFFSGAVSLGLVFAGAGATNVAGAVLAAMAVLGGMAVELAFLERATAPLQRRWQETGAVSE